MFFEANQLNDDGTKKSVVIQGAAVEVVQYSKNVNGATLVQIAGAGTRLLEGVPQHIENLASDAKRAAEEALRRRIAPQSSSPTVTGGHYGTTVHYPTPSTSYGATTRPPGFSDNPAGPQVQYDTASLIEPFHVESPGRGKPATFHFKSGGAPFTSPDLQYSDVTSELSRKGLLITPRF